MIDSMASQRQGGSFDTMAEPVLYDTVDGYLPSYRMVREGLKSVVYFSIRFSFHDIQWEVEERLVASVDSIFVICARDVGEKGHIMCSAE